ncbi:hypothetical protein NQ315_013546, partial [Exocentrus adspersus]
MGLNFSKGCDVKRLHSLSPAVEAIKKRKVQQPFLEIETASSETGTSKINTGEKPTLSTDLLINRSKISDTNLQDEKLAIPEPAISTSLSVNQSKIGDTDPKPNPQVLTLPNSNILYSEPMKIKLKPSQFVPMPELSAHMQNFDGTVGAIGHVSTPATSFHISMSAMSPCSEDTQQLIQATFSKPETLGLLNKNATTEATFNVSRKDTEVLKVKEKPPTEQRQLSTDVVETFKNLADFAKSICWYELKVLQQKLTQQNLLSVLGTKFDIFALLDYISMSVEEIINFHIEYNSLAKKYAESHHFRMNPDFSVTFEIINLKLIICWIITVKLSLANMFSVSNGDVTAVAKVGMRVNKEHIKTIVENTPKGPQFFRNFIEAVDAYVETRLTENMRTKIPGYVVYRQDKNRPGGGVVVAIKRGIDHYMLQVPQLDTIEAVAVEIRTSRYADIATTLQGIVHTKRNKAEAFTDRLELQCRENQIDDEDEEHTALVERRARRIGQTPDDEEIRPTSPEEVKRILEYLNPRK